MKICDIHLTRQIYFILVKIYFRPVFETNFCNVRAGKFTARASRARGPSMFSMLPLSISTAQKRFQKCREAQSNTRNRISTLGIGLQHSSFSAPITLIGVGPWNLWNPWIPRRGLPRPRRLCPGGSRCAPIRGGPIFPTKD